MRRKLIIFLVETIIFSSTFDECNASTHWVVTEDGKIQAQLDSVFSLRRPYDMVALMQQEERAVLVEQLKQQLMARKEEIDLNEDKETDLEERFYLTDADCVASGKPLNEFNLYLSTSLPVDYKGMTAVLADAVVKEQEYKQPNCSEVFPLNFSMHAFEHLTGMRERHALKMTAEKEVPLLPVNLDVILHYNVDIFGHLIFEALQKNKTSSVWYNLATNYWRKLGDAPQALECARRALHFSPRADKAVTLVNLGNILHRANYSEEAAIVLHAAVDIAPDEAVCHFTLGNIYAVLEDYNKSALCFENALKLKSKFKDSVQRLQAVCCLSKLAKSLDAQHMSLQKTLVELREHQQQHEYWLTQQEKLMQEQAPIEVKLEQQLQYEEQKIRESLDGRGQDCYQFQQNGHTILSCNMRREAYHQGLQTHLDLSLNLQLIQAVEAQVVRTGQRMISKSNDQC